MWMAGDHEQERKGTGSPPLQWQQTTTLAKATSELPFSLFIAIRSWQTLPTAHPWEWMLSRHLTEVKHSNRSPNKTHEVFLKGTYFHLLVPTQLKSAFVAYLPKHCFLHSTHTEPFCFQQATDVNGPSLCSVVGFESQGLWTSQHRD